MAKRGAADNARPARHDIASPDKHSRSPHRDDPPGQPSPLHKPKANRAHRAEEPASPKVPDWPRADCSPEEFHQAFIDITTDLLGQINAVNERVDAVQRRGCDPEVTKLDVGHKDHSEKLFAVNARLDAMDALLPRVDLRVQDLDERHNELRKNLDQFGKLVADDAGRKEGHIERLAKLEIATEEYVAQLKVDAKEKFDETDAKLKGTDGEIHKLQAENAKRHGEIAQLLQLAAARAKRDSAAPASTSTSNRTSTTPCHCSDGCKCVETVENHVVLLQADVGRLDARIEHLEALARRAVDTPPSVPATDEWQKPGRCPWSAGAQAGWHQGPGTGSNHPGQGGGGDDGRRGSGGGAGPGGDVPPSAGTGGHVGPTDYNIEKLFDDKVALADKYQFGGGDGGERWRVKIRGYWISKFPALQGILNWAEGMDEKRITTEMISAKHRDHFWMTEASVPRLSELLWGFLNTCLTGGAHTCFEGADVLNGLDAWRLVVNDIQKGRLVRTAQLRKLIRNPQQIAKLEDVDRGITRFENMHREYASVVGDRAPHDDEKRTDLLECLPGEIREQLLARATVKGEDFADFANHVRSATNSILYHRGKIASPLNVVNSAGDAKTDTGVTEKLQGAEEMICAVLKKMGFQGQWRDGGGQRTDGQQGGARPVKCANCQAEGHVAKDCRKPRVEMSKRLCYECGKPGHVARDCRNKATRPGAASVRMVDEEEDFFGCVACEGWQIAGRSSAGTGSKMTTSRMTTRPMPSVAELGDFMPTKVFNKYDVLTSNDVKPMNQKQRKAVLAKNLYTTDPSGSGARSRVPADEPVTAKPSGTGIYRLCPAGFQDFKTPPGRHGQEGEVCTRNTTKEGPCMPCSGQYKETRSHPMSDRTSTPSATATTSSTITTATLQSSRTTTSKSTSVAATARASVPAPSRPGQPGPRIGKGPRSGDGPLQPAETGGPDSTGKMGEHALNPCRNTDERQMMVTNEPNDDLDRTVAPCYYEEDDDEDGEEILAATEETEANVALDSGAVAHVVGPNELPGNTPVEQPEDGRLRNFVGANNSRIKNYGKAKVEMTTDDGKTITNTFNVADVSRPLHAVSVVCDTNKEVLFTKGEAVVVPDGALSRFLGAIKAIAKYPRKGGLYVAKMRVKNPRPKPATASGFGRQGTRR